MTAPGLSHAFPSPVCLDRSHVRIDELPVYPVLVLLVRAEDRTPFHGDHITPRALHDHAVPEPTPARDKLPVTSIEALTGLAVLEFQNITMNAYT